MHKEPRRKDKEKSFQRNTRNDTKIRLLLALSFFYLSCALLLLDCALKIIHLFKRGERKMKNKKEEFSRREFLSKAVTSFASAGILTVSGNKLLSSDNEKTESSSQKEIIYRTLGKTGIRIPIVNMGVMNSSDPVLVRKSYESGIRHFDTAAWYMRGKNEEMLGKLFKEMNIRDKVIIGTKVYIPHERRNMSVKEVKEQYLKIAEESRKRLQTDYVDILYSHSVSDLKWLNNPGIIEALTLLKEQKKVRSIGFSTHRNMVEFINGAIKSGIYDVIETAFNYSMCEYEELILTLKNASAKGIGLIAMKTLRFIII